MTLEPSSPFFSRLKADFDAGAFHWVGEFSDFALGYITFASTLLAHVHDTHAMPVGAVVIGDTSSGKTELSNSLMKLFPKNHVIHVTSLSAKSLVYRCIDEPDCLHGKVIFVEELSGLKNEDLQYMLRILVTRGEVRHVTAIGGKPTEIFVKGHISLQTTGLPGDRLRDDTMNRLVTIKSDSSAAVTIKVIERIKDRYGKSKNQDAVTLKWYQDFYKGLEPRRVFIPFAADLPLSATKPRASKNRILLTPFLAHNLASV